MRKLSNSTVDYIVYENNTSSAKISGHDDSTVDPLSLASITQNHVVFFTPKGDISDIDVTPHILPEFFLAPLPFST